MDLLRGDVKHIYFQYLSAAFGSAMISAIYGVVDMAMVGQYQGPEGTAALAVVAPIWNIIYSLGLLTGIGGSVLLGMKRGQGRHRQANEYFTAALLFSVALGGICWVLIGFFDTQLLLFFGAEGNLLPLAKAYILPIKFVAPVFLLNQMLACFLRNDNAPGLATAGVLIGGIFNMFGDYYFVFTMDMGIMGAGLATAMGGVITLCILLSHFLSRKNALRVCRPKGLVRALWQISVTGFSTFVVDVAMGVLTVLFNRQIITYLGTDALSVYGVMVNLSTIVQCCAYSVGQAAQPILSINFGAGNRRRMGQALKYALYSAGFFSVMWTAVVFAVPNGIIQIFMVPTQAIYAVAPPILRTYGLSFLLLPLNIFSTYYFQALMKPATALFVSVTRGVVVSGAMILVLPVMLAPQAIWLAMPITEAVVAVFVVMLMVRYNTQR